MEDIQYQKFMAVEDAHWWFRGRKMIIRDHLRRFLPGNTPLKLIDIGAGTGGTSALLQEFGEVTIAEPHADAIAWAKKRFADAPDMHYVHANWENLDLPGASFDVLTAFDVLEHCEDDTQTLKTWTSLVKPGGHVILTVPAFDCLWGVNDEISLHYRRYTKSSLLKVIRAANLEVLDMAYFNFFLFPPAFVSRFFVDRIKKVFTKENDLNGISSDLDLPPAPINAALTMLFSSERHALPLIKFPVGVSLIAVLKAN